MVKDGVCRVKAAYENDSSPRMGTPDTSRFWIQFI